MSGDLRVDFAALEGSVERLHKIRTNLENLKGHTADTADLWGHAKIAGAMDEFSGNMDYNQGKLIEVVLALGEMCEGTVEAFRSVESELAKAFEQESS